MKIITLNCHWCKEPFERKLNEHNKNLKKGRTKHFCKLSCFAYDRNQSMPTSFWQEQYKNRKVKPTKLTDEFSPFRYFLNKCKSRDKEYDMDLKYLKELWETQKGMCPYTKIKMILPRATTQTGNCHSLKRASLDRIDSSKGYIKGNVEFVCFGINLAKTDYTKKEMEEFIIEIRNSSIQIGGAGGS